LPSLNYSKTGEINRGIATWSSRVMWVAYPCTRLNGLQIQMVKCTLS
jgi:hypothetical protein